METRTENVYSMLPDVIKRTHTYYISLYTVGPWYPRVLHLHIQPTTMQDHRYGGANCTRPFYTRDLRICRFWYPQGSWSQPLRADCICNMSGRTCKKMLGNGCLSGRAWRPQGLKWRDMSQYFFVLLEFFHCVHGNFLDIKTN